MDHMRISGPQPSSMILGQTKYFKKSVADTGFQKRGAGFFFFFALQREGGGTNFAKKKKQQTNHRSVFNSSRIYQNTSLEIPEEEGGLGVLPHKFF